MDNISCLLQLSLEDFTQNADVFSENSDGGAYHDLKVSHTVQFCITLREFHSHDRRQAVLNQ